jgi:hypothetical protein
MELQVCCFGVERKMNLKVSGERRGTKATKKMGEVVETPEREIKELR